MDLSKAIQQLYAEKARLEESIALLEGLQKPNTQDPMRPQSKSRRGRKNMGSEERRQVSSRMRAYWASRRAQELKS